MIYQITIEVDEEQIDEYVADLQADAWDVSKKDILGKINNLCYFGIDSIEAMIAREFNGEINASGWVEIVEEE